MDVYNLEKPPVVVVSGPDCGEAKKSMMIWRNWLAKSKSVSKDADGLADYPLREYVASMASELAQLARQDGDDRLAKALDGAAQIARDEKREPA